ncbi:hypothetical protein EGT62_09100 [Acinetobacter junii]|nr:hypothetical protein EGT62_09100 [Acinetobacter junii]
MFKKFLVAIVLLLALTGVIFVGVGAFNLDYLFIVIGMALILVSYLLKREFNLYLLFWKD